MLRVSCRVFRPVAQQLFRDDARLFEFYLRPRLIALEKMNGSLQESLRRRRSRVSDQWSPREFLHNRTRFGKLPLQRQYPIPSPGYQTTRIDTLRNRSRLFFDHAKVTSPCCREICFQRSRGEQLRRCRDRTINSLVGGLEIAQ